MTCRRWLPTSGGVPKMVLERVYQVATETPDDLAIIDDPVTLTYSDLAGRAAALAEFLRSRAGLRQGGIAAVSLPNCWQYPICFFAVAGLGGICMPFNSQWRANEIHWFVRRLGIGIAITCRDLRPAWDEAARDLPGLQVHTIDGGELEDVLITRSAADLPLVNGVFPALYLATSGSTGRPKVVPRTHQNLLAGARAVAAALDVQRGARFLSVVPFHHANGFANGMFLPLTSGGAVVLVRKALPSVLAEKVHRHGVEIVNMSPILYSLLAEHGVEPEEFGSVKIYLSSGAPLPPVLAQAWRKRFGQPIRQLYGSSETGTLCIEGAGSAADGSVGKPLATVTVQVLDSEGRPLPVGQHGEIAVRGPAMMTGYVDEPELNHTAFAQGLFRMGDLGHLTADGELVLEGRSKRWINSGGVKVDPVEVENVIHRLAAVAQCKVIPGRDSRGLEVIRALIVLRPDAQVTRREIVSHCRQELAEYKIPRMIEFVDAMPVDLAGKTPMEWLAQ